MRRSTALRRGPSAARPRHTQGLLEKLSIPYPRETHALFTEVRNTLGVPEAGDLTCVDALAVELHGPGWTFEGFELKLSRADFLRELRSPEKGAGIRRHCKRFWYVVAAPWKKTVLSTATELPDYSGLLEIGTGAPRVIEPAIERAAEPPTLELLRSLLRRSAANDQDGGPDGAPLCAITRPRLSRSHVGLSCLHTAPRPLRKHLPPSMPCFSCAEGRAPDLEVLRAVIEEASDEQRAELGLERAEIRRAA